MTNVYLELFSAGGTDTWKLKKKKQLRAHMKKFPIVTQSHLAWPNSRKYGNDTLKITLIVTSQTKVIKGYPNNN